MMIRTEFTFPSALSGREITAYSWSSGGKCRGVVQLVHGMQEHMRRYDDFAVFLASHGFVVYGSDHLGHGKSIRKESDYGYFGPSEGWRNLVSDQYTLMQTAKKEHPHVPFILIGHSMGSFIAREMAAEYGQQLDMAIFLGTSDGDRLLKIAKRWADHGSTRHGIKTPASMLGSAAFASFQRKIKHPRTHHDWLSTLPEAVDAFILDTECGRDFTYGGFQDLFTLLARVSAKEWAYRLPKKLPMLLVSGKEDPVGAYGKGIRHLANRLMRADCCCISVKLYANMRHCVLHEARQEQVYDDILKWILRYLPKSIS